MTTVTYVRILRAVRRAASAIRVLASATATGAAAVEKWTGSHLEPIESPPCCASGSERIPVCHGFVATDVEAQVCGNCGHEPGCHRVRVPGSPARRRR